MSHRKWIEKLDKVKYKNPLLSLEISLGNRNSNLANFDKKEQKYDRMTHIKCIIKLLIDLYIDLTKFI